MSSAQRGDNQDQGVDLGYASFVALTALVQSASTDQETTQLIYQLMVEVMKQLESTINSQTMPQGKASEIQNQICPLL